MRKIIKNHLKKKIAVFGFATSLLISLFIQLVPQTALAAFKDVDEKDSFYEAVEFLEKNGWIESGKNFFPSAYVNRAILHKLVWNTAGYTAKKSEKGLTNFKDVSAKEWFAPYVKKSLLTDIVELDKKNPYFHPEEKVTRAEVLKTIFDIQGIGTTKIFSKKDIPFLDVGPFSKFAPIAKTALEFGLFQNEKKFQPDKKVTRAQLAEYLYTIDQKLKNEISSNENIQIIQLITENAIPGGADGDDLINNPKFNILVDIWKKIRHRFMNKEKVDDDKLIYGAIAGMVQKLGDKYTVFNEPQAANSLNESLSGEFEGIGISIDIIDEKVTIISPLRDTPADKAGLQPNDIITKVDGKKVEGLTLEQVSMLIKGPKGSTVTLTILRGKKEFPVEIIREKIKVKVVDGYMKNGTAVIQINSFSQNTDIEFKKAAEQLIEQNPKGFIIDLRNNPGGFLDTSLKILDQFLPKDKEISTLVFSNAESALATFNDAAKLEPDRVSMPKPEEIQYISRGPGTLSQYKIVVLQNKGSASASEIVAAALRDNLGAVIVGDNSFGKGSVQELSNYTDGSQFKISIAKWLTPAGINLTENPIKPDHFVKDDFEKNGDEVMEFGLNLVK